MSSYGRKEPGKILLKCLSAVDTVVAKHLFDKCIRGLLGDRVVVLVTHQLHFAIQADKILALTEVNVYNNAFRSLQLL